MIKFGKYSIPKFYKYPVKGRNFNIIFEVFDLQGDGTIQICFVFFEKGYKMEIGFSTDKKIWFGWRLFEQQNTKGKE